MHTTSKFKDVIEGYIVIVTNIIMIIVGSASL
jgi:hypothetical protein